MYHVYIFHVCIYIYHQINMYTCMYIYIHIQHIQQEQQNENIDMTDPH